MLKIRLVKYYLISIKSIAKCLKSITKVVLYSNKLKLNYHKVFSLN